MWNNKFCCWPCLLFTNEHELCNKQSFSDLNHLSNAQRNTQIHVHCYLQLQLLENNKELTCSSTGETTSPGIMNKLKRAHEYYVGFLMLHVLYQIKNFRSGAMMNRPHLWTTEISWNFAVCWKIIAHFSKIIWIQPLLFSLKYESYLYLMKFAILKFE